MIFLVMPFKQLLKINKLSYLPLAKTRSIPFNQITAVSLIDDLPQERIRTMGAATDSYLTGEFKSLENLLIY